MSRGCMIVSVFPSHPLVPAFRFLIDVLGICGVAVESLLLSWGSAQIKCTNNVTYGPANKKRLL